MTGVTFSFAVKEFYKAGQSYVIKRDF
jgi:hypothetical protein